LLVLVLFLYWIWVRKREYWADYVAIQQFKERVDPTYVIQHLLSGSRVKNFMRHAALGDGIWHPSSRARIRAALSELPRGGFYTTSGSLIVISTIFLFRYVMGNNTGYGTQDYPSTFSLFLISIFYFCGSYLVTECLVFPLSYPD